MDPTVSTVRHNAIIVTASGYVMDGAYADIPVPDVEGFRASLPESWRRLVIGPVVTQLNGYHNFAFLPDGSYDGWDESDLGDQYRQRFIDLFSFAYEDGSTPFQVVVMEARFGEKTESEPRLEAALNPHVTLTGEQG
jgi:hypothetical protein